MILKIVWIFFKSRLNEFNLAFDFLSATATFHNSFLEAMEAEEQVGGDKAEEDSGFTGSPILTTTFKNDYSTGGFNNNRPTRGGFNSPMKSRGGGFNNSPMKSRGCNLR